MQQGALVCVRLLITDILFVVGVVGAYWMRDGGQPGVSDAAVVVNFSLVDASSFSQVVVRL